MKIETIKMTKRLLCYFSLAMVYSLLFFSCKDDLGNIAVNEIKTEKSEYTLAVGELAFIKTIILPDHASGVVQTWTSSDPSVALIDRGEITGIAAGNATVTLTAGGKTVSFAVTVTAYKIDVEDIVFDSYELSVVEGESQTVAATVLPENATNKTLEWTSDNESVALVDENGTVSALQEGEAYITATSVDSGKKITTKVIVEKKGSVLGVQLNLSAMSLTIGQSGDLVATVLPNDAINKNVIWESDNPSVATVDQQGKVTGLSFGEAIVSVTTEDGGKAATCRVSVLQIYTDDFNRPNTGLKGVGEFIDADHHWTIANGSFEIIDHRLKAVQGGAPKQSVILYKANGAITKNSGGSFRLVADMIPKVTSSWAGIVFNAQDENSYYVFRLRTGTANVQFLATSDNGATWTVLTTQAVSSAANFNNDQTYRFVLTSSEAGKYRLRITDQAETANYGEFNLTDNDARYTNGYAGFWGQFDQLFYDNFYLEIK